MEKTLNIAQYHKSFSEKKSELKTKFSKSTFLTSWTQLVKNHTSYQLDIRNNIKSHPSVMVTDFMHSLKKQLCT